MTRVKVLIVIVVVSCLAAACSGHDEDDGSCVFYEDSSDLSTFKIYGDDRGADGDVSCTLGVYDSDSGKLIKSSSRGAADMCARVISAFNGIDGDIRTNRSSHMLVIKDGARGIVDGPVDLEKAKPVLDVLRSSCPSIELSR